MVMPVRVTRMKMVSRREKVWLSTELYRIKGILMSYSIYDMQSCNGIYCVMITLSGICGFAFSV